MFNQPKLRTFTIFASLFVICLVGKDYLPIVLGEIVRGLAWVFAASAVLAVGNWMADNWTSYKRMLIDAENDTWEVKLTRNLAGIPKETVDAWRDNVPILALLAGEPYPIRTVNIGGEQILYSFVRKFIFEDGTETNLAPVGLYSEGSHERKYAQTLTGYLVGNGYAKPAISHYPASWVNRKLAIKSLGLEG